MTPTTQTQKLVTGLQRSVPQEGFHFRREHFGLLSVAFLTLALINLLVSMVSGDPAAYRLLPAWFLLLALTSASSFLIDAKILAWVLTVAFSVGVEFLRYREYHSEILLRTAINYAPLTAFMLILFSARLEELRTRRDQAYARLKVLRNDSNDRLRTLKKLRSGEEEPTQVQQAENIRVRHLTFEIYQEIFPRILQIRFKREIPPILQFASQECFGLQYGVIYEIPPEKTAEVQIRAQWGVDEGDETIRETLVRYARSDLVRTCDDSRNSMQVDFIKRKPNLYEEFDVFSREVFPIECLFPCVVLGKTMFVMIAGGPTEKGRVPYDFSLLGPIFSSCGLAMSKLVQKDARARFSAFGGT